MTIMCHQVSIQFFPAPQLAHGEPYPRSFVARVFVSSLRYHFASLPLSPARTDCTVQQCTCTCSSTYCQPAEEPTCSVYVYPAHCGNCQLHVRPYTLEIFFARPHPASTQLFGRIAHELSFAFQQIFRSFSTLAVPCVYKVRLQR
jgi:hypothetical protein